MSFDSFSLHSRSNHFHPTSLTFPSPPVPIIAQQHGLTHPFVSPHAYSSSLSSSSSSSISLPSLLW